MRQLQGFIWQIRFGLASVTIRYVALTLVSLVVYYFVVRLDHNGDAGSLVPVLLQTGDPVAGLKQVWFIFTWGFGVQLLVQVVRIVRRVPKDAPMRHLVRQGAWLSLNAGIFEEIIFRVYAFLSFVIIIRFLDGFVGGTIRLLGTRFLLPIADFLTLGVFSGQFNAAQWPVGLGILVGALFFRNAHRHYGAFSKANVFVIGLCMFWLVFHYGVMTAMIAHVLYDMAVFAAIALASPLQPAARQPE